MFAEFFGLPLHPLIVHATVMFIIATAVGVIALAIRPQWRHKYGLLLVIVSWLSVLSAWVAVESGNLLTAYPGLGATPHAAGGTALFVLLIPFAIIVTLMVGMDRKWHWNVNKHGGVWRDNEPQAMILSFVCVLAVIASLVIVGQTAIVGHSGAEASWSDVDLSKFLENHPNAAASGQLFKDNTIVIRR